ncbi:MAG: DUF1989 domain-containing protein [Alphaproteobacteria bacterium]
MAARRKTARKATRKRTAKRVAKRKPARKAARKRTTKKTAKRKTTSRRAVRKRATKKTAKRKTARKAVRKRTTKKVAKRKTTARRKTLKRKAAPKRKTVAKKATARKKSTPSTAQRRAARPTRVTNNGPGVVARKPARLEVVSGTQSIRARHGMAAFMKKGQYVKVVNDKGMQVLDNWAIAYPDVTEYMTMEHTRFEINRLRVKKGDVTWSNRRRPMFTMVEDTSWGYHDTQVASCDIFLYKGLGVRGYHRSCTDNFWQACADIGIAPPHMPGPLNLFQHTLVEPDESYIYPLPTARPGCYVTLRAEQDLVIVFSACPFDLPQYPVNGPGGQINDCRFQIY